MATVCVFTPTYNRAYVLPKLYKSLVSQTSHDFSWLVVDDGSTDNTAELVHGWQAEGLVPITFIRQENGGKQRATNTGMEHCKDELFFVVDSDDYLVPTAIEQVVEVWQGARNDATLAGIVALRGSDEETPLGTHMPAGVSRVKMWDLLHKYH
jgi:glycosyltransferase involved in cell wall biosynthesis